MEADKKNKESSNRLAWPDVAKGICIISVILGHLGVDAINRVVFTYHLPVFFLLSGYFMKKTSDKKCIEDKARRLLIPYALTCVVICIVSAIFAGILGTDIKDTLFSWVGAALYGAGDSWEYPFFIKGIGAIWFLWALFFAVVIVNHFLDKKYSGIVIFCIAFAGWLSFDITQVWLPLSIQAGMLASLYVYIGYYVRQHEFLLKDVHVIPFVGATLAWLWSIQHFKGFWLVHNYMGNGWLDFLTSLCAAYFIIVISKYISVKTEWLKNILCFYGKNSLIILCAHLVELNVFRLEVLSEHYAAELSLNQNQGLLLLILMKMVYVTLVVVAINRVWGCRLCKKEL